MVAILASVLFIVYEVVVRYFFKMPTVWEIEASIFGLIFITFVGSVFALKNDAHIKLDIVTIKLPKKAQRWLSIITSLLSLAFCGIATVKSWQIWWEAYSYGWKSETLWAPPLAVPYAFLAIGLTFMSFQFLVNISDEIKTFSSEKKC
jgi:TRAP-type C4-dicarboxylate transport system permease small subunit